MKIFDKRFGIAFCFTMLFLLGLVLVNANESYALPALGVPEITSFGKSDLEDNALKLVYKTNNTGTDFSIEVIEATTKVTNNLSGSVTSYTYQNLEEGKEYKVQVRACTNSATEYVCSDWSEVATAIAGFKSLGIKSVKLSTTKYVYNGKAKTPGVTVIDDNNNTLVKGTDYTVTLPSKRTAIGKYKVTVKGKGIYDFTKGLSFVINPPKTSISKVTSTKNSITVKYKKAKGGVKYQVGYKKASAKSYKYLSATFATSKKITGLSSGTSYNVVVRCTKKVNNVNYIGANSAKKTKKTTSVKKKTTTKKKTTQKKTTGTTNTPTGTTKKPTVPRSKSRAGVESRKSYCKTIHKKYIKKTNKCGGCLSGYKKNSKGKCVKKGTYKCYTYKKAGTTAKTELRYVYKVEVCKRKIVNHYTTVSSDRYKYYWSDTGKRQSGKRNSGTCTAASVGNIRATTKTSHTYTKYCGYF